jgi:colanic acid/amylovoran biosynthesis protein
MRIFIEPGGYRWGNLGDTMMLDAALRKLRSFWRDASITVHCLDPERLRLLDPAATALDPSGAQRWSRIPSLLRAGARLSPSRRLRLVAAYRDAVQSADLVLASGAGGLADPFREQALLVLQTMQLAIDAGAVTALMGQGIGPISEPALRTRAAEVLPRVDFIALRERLTGPSLLHSLGVATDRIAVTGDDTIPLAYDARPKILGTALGINIRVAPYSGLDDGALPGIGRVMREAAASYGTTLVPVPISRYSHEDDVETVRRMLGSSDGVDVSTPEELLSVVARCRVVVTGSYHAGVLALSMGIPVVAVADSSYYAGKFHGLGSQFVACRVVLTSDRDFHARLSGAIDDAWESADMPRASLLDLAERQIAEIDRAYRHVFDLVEARDPLRKRL